MNNLGIVNDYVFDWTENKPKQTLQRSSKTPSLMKNVKSSSKYTVNHSGMTPKIQSSRFEKK